MRAEPWARTRCPPLPLAGVKRRLNTSVSSGDATVSAIAAAWPGVLQPVEDFPCLNPHCPSSARIKRQTSRRGRPQLFCTSKCRRAYDYERAQLLNDQARLIAALQRAGGTYRERALVESVLATVQRCLLHYPSLGGAAASVVAAESRERWAVVPGRES